MCEGNKKNAMSGTDEYAKAVDENRGGKERRKIIDYNAAAAC